MESKKSLTAEIKEWVESTSGEFDLAQCDRELGITTKSERGVRRVIFHGLVKDGTLLRNPNKEGKYRKAKVKIQKMDLSGPVGKGEKIKLPLGLHKLCKLYPGNIIIVAGERNSGKTAFALNTAADNLVMWKTHYFNSEMGPEELSVRLRAFEDVSYGDWEKYVSFYEKSSDFASVIVPGQGNLNIIDYMEIHENHFLIGAWIKDIHDKLDGALCMIVIQKNIGRDYGVGGEVTLEKPRLYLAMSSGEIKIVKAKNFKDPFKNPNGLRMKFKLVGGAMFLPQDEWSLGGEDEN